MSLVDEKAFLHLLMANKAVYVQLIDVMESRLTEEQEVLSILSEQALLDSSVRDRAVMQLGRVSFLRDILTYTKHLKTD